MKLGAVGVMWEVDAHDKGCLSQHYRQKSVEEKLALCSFCPSTFWIDAQKRVGSPFLYRVTTLAEATEG